MVSAESGVVPDDFLGVKVNRRSFMGGYYPSALGLGVRITGFPTRSSRGRKPPFIGVWGAPFGVSALPLQLSVKRGVESHAYL